MARPWSRRAGSRRASRRRHRDGPKAQHRRQNRRRSHCPLQPLTVRSTGYLMLATSLPTEVPTGNALEAYRLRRHVELASKRLKRLLGPGRLPAKNEALARRWLLARPVTALLIEGTSRPLLRSPPQPTAMGRRGTWLWRVTPTLRDALLAALRGVLGVEALLRPAGLLARRLPERCRRRRMTPFDSARRHGRASSPRP